MKMLSAAAVLALAVAGPLGLAACSKSDTAPTPQGSSVAAAMPDTSVQRAPNEAMTAPDAGVTGTVPADGSAPAVAQTPAVGTAGTAMSQPPAGQPATK